MITNKNDLKFYLRKDREILGRTKRKFFLFKNCVWKYEIALRYHEYYANKTNKTLIDVILLKYWKLVHFILSHKLGIQIPINVFGPGLRINHFGLLIVNTKCKIGANCDIHQGVNIGTNFTPNSVPKIGNNVWIGPGVKMCGNITIGDNVVIGAGAVVTKSFPSNVTIAGVPAKIIKEEGNPYAKDRPLT